MPCPRAITPEAWNAIVAVYQAHGGPGTKTAKALGWPAARTARIWHEGYPSKGFPPVRTLLGHDGLHEQAIRAARQDREAEARAQTPLEHTDYEALRSAQPAITRAEVVGPAEAKRMARMVAREDEREKARQDMVKSRAEEASLVSNARRNSLALNVITAQVLRGAQALAGKIRVALEEEARDPAGLPLATQLSLMRQAASIARFNAEASMLAVKAERMVLGTTEPAEAEGDGSLEEAAQWIEHSVRAVQRARQRGLIVVLPGETPTAEHDRVSPGLQVERQLGNVSPGLQTAEPEAERAELPTAAEARGPQPRQRGRAGLIGLK